MGEIEGLARREVLLIEGHTAICPASESRYWMIVARSAASSMPASGPAPAVGYGLVPARGAFALAHDDPESVVAQVERLSGALPP